MIKLVKMVKLMSRSPSATLYENTQFHQAERLINFINLTSG